MHQNIAPETSPHLTPREREVLRWLGEGKTVRDAAVILGIAEKTAGVHVCNMMQKLDLVNRVELIMAGIRMGVVPCPCQAHAAGAGPHSPTQRP